MGNILRVALKVIGYKKDLLPIILNDNDEGISEVYISRPINKFEREKKNSTIINLG